MSNLNPQNEPVAVIIGASRGIGRQIAIDLSRNGYFVVVSAKSSSPASPEANTTSTFTPPDPNSQASTIHTVVQEIESFGRAALAVSCNVRSHDSINSLISTVVTKLSRVDVLVYNPGAIFWSAISTTPLSRYKLMQEVNSEGLYSAIQAVLPHFFANDNSGRIIIVSPPIYQRFTHGKGAYAMTKIAMSVLTKALAKDFQRMGEQGRNLAVTSIWPAAAIESAATEFNKPVSGPNADNRKKDLRKPTIFSDAILAMLRADTKVVNGLIDTDEDFLRRVAGYNDDDFAKYSVIPGMTPRRIMPKRFPDLTVEEEDDEGVRMDSVKLKNSKL